MNAKKAPRRKHSADVTRPSAITAAFEAWTATEPGFRALNTLHSVTAKPPERRAAILAVFGAGWLAALALEPLRADDAKPAEATA